MTENFAFRSVHIGHAITPGLAESQMEEALVESFAVDRESNRPLPYCMVISITPGKIRLEEDLSVQVKKQSVYNVRGYVFDNEDQKSAALQTMNSQLDETNRKLPKS